MFLERLNEDAEAVLYEAYLKGEASGFSYPTVPALLSAVIDWWMANDPPIWLKQIDLGRLNSYVRDASSTTADEGAAFRSVQAAAATRVEKLDTEIGIGSLLLALIESSDSRPFAAFADQGWTREALLDHLESTG